MRPETFGLRDRVQEEEEAADFAMVTGLLQLSSLERVED
jgi:hypothetical protein